MSLHSVDEQIFNEDVRRQPIKKGTIGADHVIPGALGGAAMRQVVTVFDDRVSYHGNWTLSTEADFSEYLGQRAVSNTQAGSPNDRITFTFRGTKLAIVGSEVNTGGQAQVFIDDVLQGGIVNTYCILSAAYGSTGGLNATDTTINVTSTSDFNSTGYIQIDNEIISFTGTTSTSFTGCTRGIAGSSAATHNTASMVYAYSSTIDFYTLYKTSRIPLWRNNQLPQGQHTVVIQSTGQHSTGSLGYQIWFSGFVVNGQIGASNIATNIQVATASVTFDSNGHSTNPLGLDAFTVDQQILGVIGCAAYGSSMVWCGHSFDPIDGFFWFYSPQSASSTVTVSLTMLVVGQTY